MNVGMIARTIRTTLLGLTIGFALAVGQAQQMASSGRPLAWNIPAQPMETALTTFGKTSGLQVLIEAKFAQGRTTPEVKGELTAAEALSKLLEGTSLHYVWINEKTVAIREKDEKTTAAALGSGEGNRILVAQAGAAEGEQQAALQEEGEKEDGTQLEEIVVTGTNIKGAAPAGAPILVLDEQAIRRTGYSSIEQVIQSLPQNSRSGAEGATADSILSTALLSGFNFTRGSGANLRGLGSGATLTLLNGRRIAASSSGTFTDISLIPLSAVQRIEVLTDGASAIYGADAVGGVVNIVLKKDYDGAETRVRFGETAPSGRDEIKASQVFGTGWTGGNVLVAADYTNQSELNVAERDFTANVPSPTSIFPSNKQIGGILSLSQHIGDKWSLKADGQYAHAERDSELTPGDGTNIQRPTTIRRSGAAATVAYSASASWDVSLTALDSKEDIDFDNLSFPPGDTLPDFSSTFQDQIQKQRTIELAGTGTLFRLPAGAVSLALGGGRRTEDYSLRRTQVRTGFQDAVTAERDVDSAFAELRLPILGEAGADRQQLTVSLAGRWDKYSDFGDTFNPKIGASWLPIAGLELRSSYSTSYRAPPTGEVLSQSLIGTAPDVAIFSFATADVSGTVPVLTLLGSKNLLPEESENWTAGFTFRPQRIANLAFSVTYYDISYTDKIVAPPFDLGALSNPALQSFIVGFASPAELQAAVAAEVGGAPIYFDFTGPDSSGGEFGPNPENVATQYFDFRNTNAGVVNTSGFDVNVDYALDWNGGVWNFGVNANYIAEIDTIFAPGAPTLDLSGTVGNPANLRWRGTTSYSRAGFDGAVAVNYTKGYTDTSSILDESVDAYLTVDANLRYTFDQFALSEITLSVTNLFNEDPPFVAASGRGSNYDSANADPLGRFIAFEVSRRW